MTDNNLFPLTLPQEAFYYDYLLNLNDCKYNMGGAFILNGDLDIKLYRKSYNYVITHHDALRIKFVKIDEILYQQFRPEYECDIKYFDFRNRKNPVEEAIEFVLKEYQKPLPIESNDLFSEMIIQTNDRQFIFAPKFNHLIMDAMARAIVNKDIAATYNNLLENGLFPELKSFSYIDFINDDLQYRVSDSYKNSFEYWKKKLANLSEPFEFTSKKKSIKNISLHTERLALNLHRICFESILNIAYEVDATTFQVILGLIATTLYRCYNRNELIIGMPVLNRSNYKFRNTPGLFMNMMALRINVNPDGTFEKIINTIKSEVREGYRHQRFPLRDTIKYLRTNPEFNNELFDVTVVYRKNDFSQRFGGEKLHSITFDTGIRSESLSIEIDEYDEEENVKIFFNYNPLVISEDEIVQFVHCFETILMDFIYFPEKTLKEVKLLNDFESDKILNVFNSTSEKIVTSDTIIDLFEKTVEKYPDSIAVLYNEDTISYKELNDRANRIANYLLMKYKILPEEIICLAADRGIDAIAAMLGIMKTGAAYLPVDNDYPIERIKYIIEDSGSKILIKSRLEEINLAENVIELSEITYHNNNNTSVKINQNNLAYVIYTSGSTGKPKGVLIEHGNFMSMFVNVIGKFGIKETDHVLQFASLGFDASIFEIFQAILTGAALVIADKETIHNTELFTRYLDEKKTTIATLPPVYLSALNKAELPYVNTLITAGEQAVAADVNFYKRFKRYINGYGPTETSVCASYYTAEEEKEYLGIIPIGKPYPGSKIYILDENLAPVPIGFKGELCVSGPSLARGYLNNDELTKQKFVNNPYESGTRLYRTGDLARWKQDGNIEFLGRIDQQVKIKGNRIELGEIEAQLIKYEKVKEVTVLDVQNGDTKELAAFIHREGEINISDIKLYLRKFLPEYMIPLHYVFVENIPLTQNGKINKEALRRLPLDASINKQEYKAAANEMESRLIVMFEDILGVKPVGVDDNFFELGGESLKIARLISKIYKELKREIGFKVIFDAPTVRSIAAELEIKAVTEYKDIPVAPLKEYYALSHAQKRLWILAQNKENSAVYHMPVPILLEGELNLKLLDESIKKIVQRHESLHSVFIDINGIPYQKVLNDYDLLIEIHDLQKSGDKLKIVQKLIKEKIIAPFDLSFNIPVRADIIILEKEKNILLLVIHHIAGDGISIGIIMNELSELYNSSLNGIEYNLKPLRIQYKDYCEYEKELIENRKYNEEKQYWLKKLQSPLPVLELVYDRPRPPVKTYYGDYLFYEIEKSASASLINFCIEQNVSLYIVMVSVINILLHKYSSQEEIIVGSPVAGRNHPDLENQVGVYLNTVAIRSHIKGYDSIIDFLNEVKVSSTEAVANSNYPFDRLIQALNLDRDISRTPLFDVLVQFQDQNPVALNLTGISASFFEAEFKLNKFDLTFTFTEEDHKIKFSIGYNTDLFNKERIDNAAGHIKNIVNYILKYPENKIKEIDLFNVDEKETLKNIYSGAYKEFNKKMTIPELFEAQVNKTPDNTALVFNDKRYTYKELDERTNIIANEIKQRYDVNPNDIIGIMTNRSELIIIGILGILKAGAAYMPIEPDYPVERIGYMLQDSKAKLLLTESDLLCLAKEASESKKPDPDQITDVLNISNLNNSSDTKPLLNITSLNLAYVIYTSGSTGKPKGVMIEHRSLHNLIVGLSNEIYNSVDTSLNIALIAPFVFDASVKQIFFALLNGHCLDIVPDEVKTSGRKLLEYYEKHNISVSDGTPIHLEIILDELNPGTDKYLPGKFVIGGQQLMYQTVKKLFDITGNNFPKITNVYGPTECCDVSTCFNLSKETFANQEATYNSLPIGKPLNNIQVFILDSNLVQVPVGVSGELYISGEGLARGYVNQPELTNEKFIQLDMSESKRVYKTGDIGHYNSDGNIILSGRADDQVKIRGFRIELNEIENCLRTYGQISSAAVVSVGQVSNPEIAAYYCTAKDIGGDDLRQFLSLHLPAYMIPSYFIKLDSLPLTINGKVDKKSLPLPVKEISTIEEAVLLEDMLEEKLCNIWKELLPIDKISPADNFFKLGGHSLIAIRLASRIHKEFNIDVNIWEIFQYSTISSLAKLLRIKNPALFNSIEKVEEREYYPLSHSQRRLWFLSKLDGQNSLYNLPAALWINGNLDLQVLENVFNAIVQRHESFRTYFIEIDGEPFQKIIDKVEIKIELSDYSDTNPDEDNLKELANDYFKKEFDLSKAPLLQIKLISITDNKYMLLFNMHHIISDGWSIDVMVKEFEEYYNSFLNFTDPSLEPLRIQYKDYASWQNKILSDKSLEPVREYWQKKLSSPRPLLELPSDFKRTETFTNDGEMITCTLDKNLADALKEISSRQSASLYMALLSTVYILLHKYTGEEDLIVGSPVAGRQHYDLENQIGFFINTLVLRNEVNPENSFRELLNKVKETLNGAFENEVYPFDRLVDELDVERIRNRNPLFDVMVAWMVKNGMRMKLNFSGIEVSGMDFRISQSMFDLTFLFDETDGEVDFAIEYNTSLYKRDRINRMSEHFKQLVKSIASNPQEKIKNLEIIPAVEKEKLLFEYNNTNHPPEVEKNVIDLFNCQAELNKDNTALVLENSKVSYDELNILSNRIANHILEHVSPNKDDIIPVIVDDPLLAVASVLAIMKTGAAYLPIMSDNPPERISFILKDCKAKTVLVDNDLIFTPANNIRVLNIKNHISESLSSLDNLIIPENLTISDNLIISKNLAYVIYTSGSTGLPKGVMIEHGSISNLVQSLNENIYSRYKAGLNELMISSFAFDVSLKQIFAALCNGNTLHILSKEKRLDPREIIKYIIAEKINITDLTPSLFAAMLEEGFSEIDKPYLKEILLGSEALQFKLVKNFFAYENNKSINITNFYGPTECCVESSYFRFNPDLLNDGYEIAPIGKPIINEQIFILDKYLNLCPAGVPGEICIAGKGLARQYLNDEEKTAEKFVKFPLLNGTRIYKTGDSGRILSDGNIEFLGRIDEQVKIRGFRVELQEIENQLRSYEGIKECAVTLSGNNGTGELAAYFTSDQTIDLSKLKNHLNRFLTKYMIPVYYVQLEKIPLTANGKINKKILPAATGVLKKEKSREPQDEVELLIIRICTGVLKNDLISINDNFFEIGGHSLNAVRVISRIQKELNVDLSLKDIFYNPVLSDIAENVKKLIVIRDSQVEIKEEENIIVPISDDELKQLSNLQFEDE
jgi:amino acid adenylation domain-containing protein